jgi:GTP-binding protein
MSAPLKLTFLLSAPDVAELPDSPAEVAVVGRSNVGKSSLLNAVAARRELAKVSGKPGKTQLLNCFALEEGGTVVDLPGYGYASTASARMRAAWQERMERYLLEREPLVLTLLLVDGEVGPTRLDQATLAWMRHYEVPLQVVATKHDKVRSTHRPKRRRELAERCGVEEKEVVWVSAAKGVGLDRVRGLVRSALAPS